MDTAQFCKDDFHHRNRLRVNNTLGYKWLTVPINKSMEPINDIRINNSRLSKGKQWTDVHRELILSYYRDSPYFTAHIDFINYLYGKRWEYLVDLNMAIIEYVMECLNIDTPIIMESRFVSENNRSVDHPGIGFDDQITQKKVNATLNLIEICKRFNADTYVSGSGGRYYLAEDLFKYHGIDLTYQKFIHPVYDQVYPTCR